MKTLLIDLDGVLNEYKGDFEIDNIPPIKDGAEEFIANISQRFKLKLFTTRNKLLASKWLIEYGLDTYFDDITDIKEPSWLYIDDRCVTFEGNYEKLITEIENFKAWYK